MIETTKLLELMSARMFHDLAGPIGAIHNSTEFFDEEDQKIKEKALNLAKSSAAEAVLRLKYFRQAYGSCHDKETYLTNIYPYVKEFVANSKISLQWNVMDVMVNSHLSKVVLNLVVVACNALIYGGDIKVEQQENRIIITAAGNQVLLNEESKYLLQGDTSYITLSSANIQFYYTYLMLKEAKAKMQVHENKNMIEFIIDY